MEIREIKIKIRYFDKLRLSRKGKYVVVKDNSHDLDTLSHALNEGKNIGRIETNIASELNLHQVEYISHEEFRYTLWETLVQGFKELFNIGNN